LTKEYNFEYVKEEVINGQTTSQLHLVPKGKSEVASMDIWVSHSSWLLVQQKVVERNGDYTLVKLSNLEPNIRLSDEEFIVKYPSSTQVIDKF
jgi:outer membrane lipoprotein-sorting protein